MAQVNVDFIPLGEVRSQNGDLTRRGGIDKNAADNYAFSLDQGDRLNSSILNLNIKVKELGN
jgi:hypothetical protein